VTPFARMPLDVAETERNHRQMLWQLPDDIFRGHFGGRIPSREEKHAWIESHVKSFNPEHIFTNDTYSVAMASRPPFIHLDIHRLDGGTCKEWSDLQRIKNELVGPEYEAMEIFPAESRLIDTTNNYHLWVFADPKVRIAAGWWNRCVLSQPIQVSGPDPSGDRCAGQPSLLHNSTPGIVIVQNAARG